MTIPQVPAGSLQRLCALIDLHAMVGRARKAHLHKRLGHENGELLLEILLLAFLNGAREHPLKMGELTATIIAKFQPIDAKTVHERIEDLITVGYVLKAGHPTDKRIKFLVMTEKGRDDVARFADELIGITDTLYRRLLAYGPLPTECLIDMTDIDIVQALAGLTEMEERTTGRARRDGSHNPLHL